MAGLVPFNKRTNKLVGSDFGNFYGMLDDFFSDEFLMPRRSLARDTFKLDVEEKDNEYVVEAEMPGVKKEEISLEMRDEMLCISIERKEEREEEKKNYIHKERKYSSMSRSVYLKDVDSKNIKAKLDDGVLKINIPKLEKAKSEKSNIEIE